MGKCKCKCADLVSRKHRSVKPANDTDNGDLSASKFTETNVTARVGIPASAVHLLTTIRNAYVAQ